MVEMKRRNPRLGCRKLAEQIVSAFGVELNKDVVRRILLRYYRPKGGGPSWLTVIAHSKNHLWSVDLFRCESMLLKSYWVMVVMDVFTRRIVGFGVGAAHLDGPAVCWMFNRAIVRQAMPKYLSTDHDPPFRFRRWLANLRVLEVEEIKSVPWTPRSHTFVERLIGTIRRELWYCPPDSTRAFGSDRVLEPVRSGAEARRLPDVLQPLSLSYRIGRSHARSAEWRRSTSDRQPRLISVGDNTATVYFRLRQPLELQLATHRRVRQGVVTLAWVFWHGSFL